MSDKLDNLYKYVVSDQNINEEFFWKQVGISVLRNDFTCKKITIGSLKRGILKRKEIIDKYNSIL